MNYQRTSSQTFFQRAQREASRYGEDPFVFLRELVQNSRDAQATLIEITAKTHDGQDILICRDNGHGMSMEEFDRYLLRLYASSKESRGDMVGFFGVGFWSILLFQPVRIIVSSFRDGKASGFEIDCMNFEIQAFEPQETEQGFQITLIRPSQSPSDLIDKVRERLVFYVGHVRPLRSGGALDLFCNGERLNRDFPLPDKLGEAFRNKGFDGVIGFGVMPSVKIYKGGILIRDLTSLEEVIPRRETTTPYSGFGMYPVIAMNIEGLQVLMDRQKIFEDQILHDAVTWCERTLFRLHKKLIQNLFPMNLKNNILSLTHGFSSKKVLTALLSTILVLLLIGLFYFSLSFGFRLSGGSPLEPLAPLDRALDRYSGPTAGGEGGSDLNWDFHYTGPDVTLFRMGTFDFFDSERGLFPEPHLIENPYPDLAARGDLIEVSMGISSSDPMVLPTPPGYVALASSVTSNGQPVDVHVNQYGEPVISVPPGRVSYSVQPGELSLDAHHIEGHVLSWPEPWLSAVSDARLQAPHLAARSLALLIKDHLVYSESVDFEAATGSTWTERVLNAGGGDCDVLNGLLVLLLQSAGHDAFLSVGLIGRNGRANPDLHAWVRYRDQGWHLMDVTVSHAAASPASSTADQSATMLPGRVSTPVPGPPPSTDPIQLEPANYWPYAMWLAPFLVLAYFLRRRKQNAHPSEPDYVGSLFLHYFSHGAVKDPLNLIFRPVFPLIGQARHLSLFEVEQYATKAPLLGAFPHSPLLTHLSQRAPVLDRSKPITETLAPLLPGVIWLEDFEAILNNHPPSDFLREIEGVIRELDPHFRLHVVPGVDTFLEATLPLKTASLGKRHLLIGSDHDLIQEKRGSFETHEIMVFDSVRRLLEAMTFYPHVKDTFLIRMSKRLAGEASLS